MSDETEAGRAVPAPGTPDDAVGRSRLESGAETGSSSAGGSGPSDGVTGGLSMSKSGSHPVAATDDDLAVESDLVDEAANGKVRESALVGASSAGSARAAARRSGVRAGSSPAKGVATKARDVVLEKRPSMVARLRRFLREVVAELRKVIWPARNQMITYTIVVIVFVVFMVALTAGLDVLFARGVLSIFG